VANGAEGDGRMGRERGGTHDRSEEHCGGGVPGGWQRVVDRND